MKYVSQIAEELGVYSSTIRRCVIRLNIEYVKINNRLYIYDSGVKKLKEIYKKRKQRNSDIFNQYKRGLLNEFLCFHIIEENNTVNAVNIINSIGLDIETAKRIFTTREVVVQSKINFGIV